MRRWASAGLAALAVGVLAHLAVSRPVPDAVAAIVAVEHVAVGTPLDETLVAVREVPGSALPEGSLRDVREVLGRPASSVLSPGEVLTRHDVRASDLTTGLPAGTVAVWVPVGDAAVTAALGGGDRVDLRSSVDGGVLARGVLVLAVGPGEPGGAWVAVADEEAGALAAQGTDPLGGGVHVALRTP